MIQCGECVHQKGNLLQMCSESMVHSKVLLGCDPEDPVVFLLKTLLDLDDDSKWSTTLSKYPLYP